MTSIGDSDLNSVDSSVFSMLLKYVVTNKKKTTTFNVTYIFDF